jgi:hypothetical protein
LFVLGHLGIGSFLAARRIRAEQIAWLLFGAVLSDLIDKPLYYALVVATGRRGAQLGLVSGTRTFGHTLLFAILVWLVVPRRIGRPLFLGISTHLFLDELGDIARSIAPVLGTYGRPGTISAILFPILGPHFPVSPYQSAFEHVASLQSAWVIAGEVIGATLLVWQWRAGIFEGLGRRRPVAKPARESTPASP